MRGAGGKEKRGKKRKQDNKTRGGGGLIGREGREAREREGKRMDGGRRSAAENAFSEGTGCMSVWVCVCVCNNGRLQRWGCKVVFVCVCAAPCPRCTKGWGTVPAGSARSILRSPLPVSGVPRGSAGRCRGDAPRRAMPPSPGRGERAAPGKAVGTRWRGDSRRLAVRQRSSCLSSCLTFPLVKRVYLAGGGRGRREWLFLLVQLIFQSEEPVWGCSEHKSLLSYPSSPVSHWGAPAAALRGRTALRGTRAAPAAPARSALRHRHPPAPASFLPGKCRRAGAARRQEQVAGAAGGAGAAPGAGTGTAHGGAGLPCARGNTGCRRGGGCCRPSSRRKPLCAAAAAAPAAPHFSPGWKHPQLRRLRLPRLLVCQGCVAQFIAASCWFLGKPYPHCLTENCQRHLGFSIFGVLDSVSLMHGIGLQLLQNGWNLKHPAR